MKKTNYLSPTILASLGVICIATMAGAAQTTLFFDDFNGPTLNSTWQAAMPTFNQANGGEATSYLGAPTSYSFQNLGGYSVLNMDSTMSDQQRTGWLNSNVFTAPGGFIYEARFNTLTLSKFTSIDAFVELSIFDAANQSLYDIASPFGASYSEHPALAAGSSINNSYNTQAYAFQSNTWYDLLVEALPGQNMQVLLEVMMAWKTYWPHQTLGHTASVYSSGVSRLVFRRL